MNETVTVDEAISRGHRMITYPAVTTILGSVGIAIYLVSQKLIPNFGFPIILAFGSGISLLWWNFRMRQWGLWAFENVTDVHELRKRAILERLIWSDSRIFEKTPIRNATDKEKLDSLQNERKQNYFFEDDLTIPDETIIYHSKMKNFIKMIIILISSGYGIHFSLQHDKHIATLSIALFSSYRIFKKYKAATGNEPQIILNEKGIKTINTDFYSWDEIEDEEVSNRHRRIYPRYYRNYYLNYYHPKGEEHLKISDYETNQRDLNKLLIVYRGRSKKKKTSR